MVRAKLHRGKKEGCAEPEMERDLGFCIQELIYHLDKGRFGRAVRPEANLQGLKPGQPGNDRAGTRRQVSDMVMEDVQLGRDPPDRFCAGPFCHFLDPVPISPR